MYIQLHINCPFVHFSCPISMKLEVPQQKFAKYSNIKFRENRLVGDELFHANGRTDGRTNERT
jgi:hypothetical protein